MALYYDNRMVVCAYYSENSKKMIQYGHILDLAYNYTSPVSSGSKTIYWNYDWYPNCFRFKFKMSKFETGDKSVTIYGGEHRAQTGTAEQQRFSLTVTESDIIFTYGNHMFEPKKNGDSYSISVKHYQQDIFSEDKEYIDIAFFVDSVIARQERKIDYGFYLNGITYIRRRLDANDAWSVDDIAPVREHYGASSYNITYGFKATHFKVLADLVYIMGCGLTHFAYNYNEGMGIYNMEVKDIYYFSPAYMHAHLNGMHNHARDCDGSSSVVYNNVADRGSSIYQYPNSPILFPFTTRSKNKNSYGAEDFAIFFGGMFVRDITKDIDTSLEGHLGRIDYRLIKGDLTSKTIKAEDHTRLSLTLSVPEHKIYLKVWADDNKTATPSKSYTGDIHWHEYLKDHFDLTIRYDHSSKQVFVTSKGISTAPDFSDYYVSEENQIAIIDNFSWDNREKCYHALGDNTVTVSSSLSQDQKRFRLTDFYAAGESSKLLKSKITFKDSDNRELEDIFIPINTNVQVKVETGIDYSSLSQIQKGLYSSSEVTTINKYAVNRIESLSPDILTVTPGANGIYNLRANTFGHYKLRAYTDDIELIAGYQSEFDVYVTVIPSIEIILPTGITNTGTKNNPACSVEVGQEFDLKIKTNMSKAPDRIQRNGLVMIKQDTVTKSGTDNVYTYHVVPNNQKIYNVTFSYDKGELNTSAEQSVQISVSLNRQNSNVMLYRNLTDKTTFTTLNVAIGDIPLQFFAVSESDIPPSIRTSPTSTVIIGRGDSYTITDDGKTKYVYPLTISGIRVANSTSVFVEYKKSKKYEASLKTFTVNVADIEKEAFANIADSKYAVFLKTSTNTWYLSQLFDREGKTIYRQTVQVPTTVKNKYKEYIQSLEEV